MSDCSLHIAWDSYSQRIVFRFHRQDSQSRWLVIGLRPFRIRHGYEPDPRSLP